MLLVIEIIIGHAISDQTGGSNVVILRLQKNDIVSVEIDDRVGYGSTILSGNLLFYDIT